MLRYVFFLVLFINPFLESHLISQQYLDLKPGYSSLDTTYNQGLIFDPLMMIQGRAPGVQIYNRGGNPNVQTFARMRGLSSYSGQGILVIKDGIPGYPLESIDPASIISIELVNDPALHAVFGMRGGEGVISIITRQPKKNSKKWSIGFKTQLSISEVSNKHSIFSKDEFLDSNGVDIGFENDWISNITRQGISSLNNFDVSYKYKHTDIYATLTRRNVNGILAGSGFVRQALNAAINQKALDDRLNISLGASILRDQQDYGFPEAFRYAQIMNPTAPIFSEGILSQVNDERFDGYYQALGEFDYYNPVAIVDQNLREGENDYDVFYGKVDFALLDETLSVYGSVLNSNRRNTFVTFYSPFSNYNGLPFNPMGTRGQIEQIFTDENLSTLDGGLSFKSTLGKLNTRLNIGSSLQVGESNIRRLNETGVQSIDEFQDTVLSSTYGFDTKLISFYAHGQFEVSKNYVFNGYFRYDGSSKLGQNSQWGSFYGVSFNADFNELLKMDSLSHLRLNMTYGKSGSLPELGGLSAERRIIVMNANGDTASTPGLIANPDLTFEKKTEYAIGLNYGQSKFNFCVTYFNKKLEDLIAFVDVERSVFGVDSRIDNAYNLRTSGLEGQFSLNHSNKESVALVSTVSMHYFFNQLKVQEENSFETLTDFSNGFLYDPIITADSGGSVGDIYGGIPVGLDEELEYIYEDINMDGRASANPTNFNRRNDFALLGNGLPNFELSYALSLNTSQWFGAILFRGAFGHQLVNRTNQFLEPQFRPEIIRNRIATEFEMRPSEVEFNSRFVESANFMKLDNLSIGRYINLGNGRMLTLILTGQNLVTVTNYSGADPEPSLTDDEYVFYEQDIEYTWKSRFISGIDRRKSYLPSRTFSISAELNF